MSESSKSDQINKAILEILGDPWKGRQENNMMETQGIIECPICKNGALEFQASAHSDLVSFQCNGCKIAGHFTDEEKSQLIRKLENWCMDVMQRVLRVFQSMCPGVTFSFNAKLSYPEKVEAGQGSNFQGTDDGSDGKKLPQGGSGTAPPSCEWEKEVKTPSDEISKGMKDLADKVPVIKTLDAKLTFQSEWIPWKVGGKYLCRDSRYTAEILEINPKLQFCVRGKIWDLNKSSIEVTWTKEGSYNGMSSLFEWDLTTVIAEESHPTPKDGHSWKIGVWYECHNRGFYAKILEISTSECDEFPMKGILCYTSVEGILFRKANWNMKGEYMRDLESGHEWNLTIKEIVV